VPLSLLLGLGESAKPSVTGAKSDGASKLPAASEGLEGVQYGVGSLKSRGAGRLAAGAE
jgi:hypothetical protein